MKKKYAIGIFLDLEKAVDVCSHEILLRKLSKLGIKDIALNWFTSYLQDRQQRVDINGSISSSRALNNEHLCLTRKHFRTHTILMLHQ
jgi:hypothetical protein